MSRDINAPLKNTAALINLCRQVLGDEHYTFDRLREITKLTTRRLRALVNFKVPDDYRLPEDTDEQ